MNYFTLPNGRFYLVHSYTGAVDAVSGRIVSFLLAHRDPERRATHNPDEQNALKAIDGTEYSPLSDSEISYLDSRGYLSSRTTEEEAAYVGQLLNFVHKRSSAAPRPGFLLIPTYECNLRCPYCFETAVRVDLSKQERLRDVMSGQMLANAFATMDLLLGQHTSPKATIEALWAQTPVGLFGGEPLQIETLGIVEETLKYCRQRNTRASAITNAVDLHHFENLLGPEGIASIQVTIDGPEDVHNVNRLGPKHRSTYHGILDNLQLAVSRGVKTVVRLHTDWTTVNRTPEILAELDRRNLRSDPNFGIYVTPRTQWHVGNALPVFPNMSSSQLHGRLLELGAPLKNSYSNMVAKRLQTYIDGGLAKLSLGMEFCSANTGSMHLLDPYGDLYACWDMVGRPEERIGTYTANGPIYTDRYADWYGRSPGNIRECRECKYVTFHFGGCSAMPLETGKGMHSPSCNDYPNVFVQLGTAFFKKKDADFVPPAPTGHSENASIVAPLRAEAPGAELGASL